MKKLVLFVAAGAFAFTSCNKAPEVSMTADKTAAKVGEVISFENTTEKGFNYVWDFGDGTSSNAFNPTHVYYEEGDYIVTLSGSDKKGRNFGTATQTINIDGFDDESDQLDEDYNEAWSELDDQETEFALSLLGTYTLTSYAYSDEDCDIEESEEHRTSTGYDATKHTVELLPDNSVIITNYLGNVMTGSWSVKKGTYINVSWGTIPVEETDPNGTSNGFSSINGMFMADLSGSTLTLSKKETRWTFDNNFDDCEAEETWEFKFSKQ